MTNNIGLIFPYAEDVAIASSGTTSAEIDLDNRVITSIQIPAAITSTTLAIHASTATGGTFTVVRINGTDHSEAVAASKIISINPANFWGYRYIKIVMGSAEGAARTLKITSVPR